MALADSAGDILYCTQVYLLVSEQPAKVVRQYSVICVYRERSIVLVEAFARLAAQLALRDELVEQRGRLEEHLVRVLLVPA